MVDVCLQEDGPADTAYAAQISKSLGRLGYGRESDKKLTRPHSQMLSTANDMVPPPALFSGAPSDNGVSWSNTSELYGVVNKVSKMLFICALASG